ncbi:MOSC domain-containing protein YiiM [Stackebrandtia albiflava]|uniref:MOSC domain-containing protein YiiM n=1 Tax=Stackebrandtia albiflava TaxID=406432 RepID=A0A562V9W7_9ACTN|nr:MOSC domain-containing protein [Stackebrandtia albiflava]TWJ14680.1 MOSC domain-containing protein YiiM [Stackebrandtia albiflava]
MRLESLNIGRVRPNPWDPRVESTGIDKRPVAGPVWASAPGPKGTGAVGLAGDRVYDVDHHGGDDQAVYAYAAEDLEFWSGRLDRELRPGGFGENFTTRGVDWNGALVGERWRVGGEAVFEVSCPRIPCATFRGWIGVKGWLRDFTVEARTGTYLRVVEPGHVSPGDPITVEFRPDHDVTITTMFKALTTDRPLLPRLLAAERYLPVKVAELARDHRPERLSPRPA